MDPTTPPAIWIARFAITSLAFMFDCVPDPVWNTTSGNSPSSRPSITSCAARTMRSTFSAGSVPSSPFACAQHFFRMPSARMTGRPQPNRPMPIGKFWIERCVCAPHRWSVGTATSPSESCSIRTSVPVAFGSAMSSPAVVARAATRRAAGILHARARTATRRGRQRRMPTERAPSARTQPRYMPSVLKGVATLPCRSTATRPPLLAPPTSTRASMITPAAACSRV